MTDQISNAIENGTGNWRMPWHTSRRFAFSPINVASEKPYRGINTVCLWAAAQAKGYEGGEWATYQQWQERKAQVRKGEKSTTVVFWKFANNAGESQNDSAEHPASGSRLLFTRGYSVFNAAKVDGYNPPADAEASLLECINQAFYSPPRTISKCPRSRRSGRAFPVTPSWRMSIRIGPVTRRDATGSWASALAIPHMPLRS